jgi:hypothetical protein
MDVWSSTVLEFCLVAVPKHTQWTILGHHNLFEKGFDPLVETTSETEYVLADILMSALVCSTVKKVVQRHPEPVLVHHLNQVLILTILMVALC